MKASPHITRLAKIATLTLAATAFAVPVARANNGIVDDWFRDGAKTTTPAGDRIVDDWFRDGAKVLAPQTSPGIVDDYFRDATKVSPPTGDRIVDDYFRDANRVTLPQSSPSGFAWGDFGIGAAAMLGLVLLVAGLGLGALALRHRGGQLETS